MRIRIVALSLLASLALILAPAGSAAEKKGPITPATAKAVPGGDGLFSFQCAIDCGDGRWFWVDVESLRECVEVCEGLCASECWVSY